MHWRPHFSSFGQISSLPRLVGRNLICVGGLGPWCLSHSNYLPQAPETSSSASQISRPNLQHIFRPAWKLGQPGCQSLCQSLFRTSSTFHPPWSCSTSALTTAQRQRLCWGRIFEKTDFLGRDDLKVSLLSRIGALSLQFGDEIAGHVGGRRSWSDVKRSKTERHLH